MLGLGERGYGTDLTLEFDLRAVEGAALAKSDHAAVARKGRGAGGL